MKNRLNSFNQTIMVCCVLKNICICESTIIYYSDQNKTTINNGDVEMGEANDNTQDPEPQEVKDDILSPEDITISSPDSTLTRLSQFCVLVLL